MKLIGKVSVFPKLPVSLHRLNELAYNLWWSWEPDAQGLYAEIDSELWTAVNHNPVKFLRNVSQSNLDRVAANDVYMRQYAKVCDAFDAYMQADSKTWFAESHANGDNQTIAYFSAEFGLHEALPIYSGGLGILSGDHCKAASDLNLPFIGVGFLYPQGYFTQRIDVEGRQQAEYEKIDFAEVPATPALDPHGNEVLIHVDLPGRTVYAKVWRIQIGRIPIFLMDTDVERNAPQDRDLSARLYGGDHEMRVSQEFVLGIGGVRALRALGYDPAVWHMNEGHSAFLGLERIRELVQEAGLRFDEAVEAVRANSVFTTHTPVPAGNDAFSFELIEKFFWQYWGQLGIDREGFLNFARQELPWGTQFSMTVLALRLSAYHNGVSALHGEVSREMWRHIWPETPSPQVPITHITNGVHTKTWLAQELRELYAQYLPENWLEDLNNQEIWQAIEQIPNKTLWAVHQERKVKMIDLIRTRAKQQYLRHGEGSQRIDAVNKILNPNALTIGFARRFATYKRATLLFRDEERLKRLLNDPERPIQILFSGKAHPADEPGKGLIQHVYNLSQQPEYEGKIVFIENYDMNIARHLISGVDIWLNTPRRPHEASGTSGQKAALSGVPNCSILDGWWVEGYIGEGDNENGWAIGEERAYKDLDTQDTADAHSLYALLEDQIIPSFFDQDKDGISASWLKRMKATIRTCGPRFSMMRMVKDYVEQLYLPGIASGEQYHVGQFKQAKEMAAWKMHLRQQWHALHIEAQPPASLQVQMGESLGIEAKVWLNGVSEKDIALELVTGEQDEQGNFVTVEVHPMQSQGNTDGAVLYSGQLTPSNSGQFALGMRAKPSHPALIHPYEMGLNWWA